MVRECFHVRRNYEAFWRPSVTESRVKKFIRNPKKYGPQVRCCFLDLNATTTTDILALEWNLALIHLLVGHAQDIARACDDGRFEGTKRSVWKTKIGDAIYRIVLLRQKTAPIRDGESQEEILNRMMLHLDKVCKRSRTVTLRHFVSCFASSALATCVES